MKLLLKIAGGTLGLLAILLVVLLVARDTVIRVAAEKIVTQQTGFPLKIQSVHVGLFDPVVKITGVVLSNPADYPESGALEIKEFSVRYDALSLLTDQIHIMEIVVDVPKVNQVTRPDGMMNFDQLGDAFASPAQPATTNQPAAAAKPAKKFMIDRLTVRFGTFARRIYKPGSPKPGGFSLTLNLNYTATNITDFKSLRDDLGTAINPGKLFDNIGDAAGKALGGSSNDINKAGRQVRDSAKGLLKGLGIGQ